jgi:hypothetical protein
VILDPATGVRQPVPGTDGAVQVRWLPSGIVYNTAAFDGANELILVSPDGSARTTLFRGDLPFRIAQVFQP